MRSALYWPEGSCPGIGDWPPENEGAEAPGRPGGLAPLPGWLGSGGFAGAAFGAVGEAPGEAGIAEPAAGGFDGPAGAAGVPGEPAGACCGEEGVAGGSGAPSA